MILIALPMVSAAIEDYTTIFEWGEDANIFIRCEQINGTVCLSSTDCLMTVFNPNMTLVVESVNMSYSADGFYNHSLGILNTTGEYTTTVICDDGFNLAGINFNFTYGETSHYYFYVILFVVCLIIFWVGYFKQEYIINMLASIVLIGLGIAIWKIGYPNFTNALLKKSIFYGILMLGSYFLILNAYRLMVEGVD